MHIKQFRYGADNLGYLVYNSSFGMAVDAGAVDDITGFAQKNAVKIKWVTNTHSHHDHTPGNDRMLEKTGARFLDCRSVTSNQTIVMGDEEIKILYTPGHTDDSVTFQADSFLITGDTLFNGTIGNCFSDDLESFFNSLKKLAAFPGETLIYSGHDYVKEAIQMARTIEEDNPWFDSYLRKYDPKLVVSTLDDERRVNSFLRFNEPSIVKKMKAQNMPVDTEYERFHSMMEIF